MRQRTFTTKNRAAAIRLAVDLWRRMPPSQQEQDNLRGFAAVRERRAASGPKVKT